MTKRFLTIITLCAVLFAPISIAVMASPLDEIVAADTIYITSPDAITPELDYNHKLFIFGIVGPDQTSTEWKTQIHYNSDSPYGTFTDEDFGLQGEGKSYNFIRPKNKDWEFYSYTHLDATVQRTPEAIVLDINGLINSYGKWRRVLVHAEIPTPQPSEEINIDLGVVSVLPNAFLGYTILSASNADYKLEFGLNGYSELKPGTYYQVELLRPELIRLPADTLWAADATLIITENGDQKGLMFNLLSRQNILYHIAMHTAPIVAKDTVDISCNIGQLYDYSLEYNIVEFYGESSDFNVTLAVLPQVIIQSQLIINPEDVVLAFTTLTRRDDQSLIRIAQASATIEILDPTDPRKKMIHAQLIATNQTLYRVDIPFGFSYLPEAKDTINIDFGEGVGRVDYTQGIGYMGLVLTLPNQLDIHLVFYNGMSLSGDFDPDYFDYSGCYLTTYSPNGLIKFTDIKAAQMRLDSINDTLRITLDAYAINDTMYHTTALLTPKMALNDATYDINYFDGVQMVALMETRIADTTLFYMQLQYADDWDEDGYPVGDAQLWTYRFYNTHIDGIEGIFGYSDGTMDPNQYHTIYEGGTEILIAPVAGTISFEVAMEATMEIMGQTYHTHLYNIISEFVGENNKTYTLSGINAIICIDAETGDFIELSEQNIILALQQVFALPGDQVSKLLHNGQILIRHNNTLYDTRGQRVQ